jgi:hypothetical protein
LMPLGREGPRRVNARAKLPNLTPDDRHGRA